MLSIDDYKHLKLLYSRFEAMNLHLKKLIIQNDWDSVEVAVKQKDDLLRQIIFFEKPRVAEIKENHELYQKKLQIIELEKENISLVIEMKQKLKQEILNASKAKRILNTYEPNSNIAKSTIELVQE